MSFTVSGNIHNPSFTVITNDGRGYSIDGWVFVPNPEEIVNYINTKAVAFLNDLVFSVSDEGVLYRNGDPMLELEGGGWSCISYNNENMMAMASITGNVCVILSK